MMQSHKAILYFSSLANGGGRTFASSLIKLLPEVHFCVASIRDHDAAASFAQEHGVDLVSIFDRQLRTDRTLRVISNSQPCALIGALLFPGRHYYVTHGFANGLDYIPRWRANLWKLQLALPGTVVVACGPGELRAIENIAPRSTEVKLVRNAKPRIEGDMNAGAASAGNSGPLRLLFVGRIAYQKGLDLLLRALDRLPTSDQGKFHLTVIGPRQEPEAEYNATVDALAASLGSSIERLPEQPVTRSLLQRFDALVMPSRFEGLPYLLLEAAEAGLPIIASDCAGSIDVLGSPEFAEIFHNEDVQSLADALVRFREASIEVRRERAQRLRIKVANEYSPEAFADGYSQLLHAT